MNKASRRWAARLYMSCTPTAQSKILPRHWQMDQRRRLHEVDNEHEVSLAFEHGLKLAFSHVTCRIGAMLYPNCFLQTRRASQIRGREAGSQAHG
jgi:hypothetical protein